MGWLTNFFSSDGVHQVVRSGNMLTDLTTGETGFVLSEGPGMSMVTDQDGGLHQIMRTGRMSTDLTTGSTYFQI